MSALHKGRYDVGAMSDGNPLSRLSALVIPLLLIIVLVVGCFVGVVRYTSLLDPSSRR